MIAFKKKKIPTVLPISFHCEAWFRGGYKKDMELEEQLSLKYMLASH